jgi:hypothetical protein
MLSSRKVDDNAILSNSDWERPRVKHSACGGRAVPSHGARKKCRGDHAHEPGHRCTHFSRRDAFLASARRYGIKRPIPGLVEGRSDYSPPVSKLVIAAVRGSARMSPSAIASAPASPSVTTSGRAGTLDLKRPSGCGLSTTVKSRGLAWPLPTNASDLYLVSGRLGCQVSHPPRVRSAHRHLPWRCATVAGNRPPSQP